MGLSITTEGEEAAQARREGFEQAWAMATGKVRLTMEQAWALYRGTDEEFEAVELNEGANE